MYVNRDFMEQRLKNLLEKLIILPKENEWVEFKRNFHDEDEIGERISAIANSACIDNKSFGYLIFGISDDNHEVLGTTFCPKLKMIGKNEFENWLIQNLTPHIDFRIYEFNYEGKHVAMFEIPAADNQPVDYKKIAYIRVGSITRKLSDFPDKERKIWRKDLPAPFETGIAIKNLVASDIIRLLDTQTYFDLMQQPYPTTQDAVIERLISDDIVVQELRGGYGITNLGGVLLAKDLNNFPTLSRKIVRVIQYEGKNKLKTLKDISFPKGYAVGFMELINYINSQLPTNEEIGEALRTQVRMYPEIAIRELVANSLIHQDFWITGTATMIELYSDRIEFSNAGIPLITPIRFIDEYRSRNEKVASLMRRMNICEEKGSGIDKVIFNCELYQLPAPDFIQSQVHMRVILYAYKQLRYMNKGDKLRAVYQHACLKWVSNDAMTNQSLRERFHIEDHNYSIASRLIKEALNENYIKEENAENKSRKFAKYIPFWA